MSPNILVSLSVRLAIGMEHIGIDVHEDVIMQVLVDSR